MSVPLGHTLDTRRGDATDVTQPGYAAERVVTPRQATQPLEQPAERSTGGGGNIIAQTSLQLSYGDRSINTPVLIRKGAPNPLLLGTNVLSNLGFTLMAGTREGIADLLTGMRPCDQEH